MDMASKPKLFSALIRAFFSHLLTNEKNISTEIFSKLMSNYPNDLQTLIHSYLQDKCWFQGEYSPFL